MNELLILFFVLPLATIIFSIVFEKIIRNPILVALLIFAIYLIVAFFTATPDNLALYIIIAILYAILAFITALITRFASRIKCCLRRTAIESNSCNNNSLSQVLEIDSNQNSSITNEYPIDYINYILGNDVRNRIR